LAVDELEAEFDQKTEKNLQQMRLFEILEANFKKKILIH
jgi:hypothetical protein